MLRDGDGLVVKHVVPGPGDGTLTLILANPDPDCRADDVHIVGKALWKVTRA